MSLHSEVVHEANISLSYNACSILRDALSVSPPQDNVKADRTSRSKIAHREYTDGYLHPLDHYGVQPRTTRVNAPQENGDVESSQRGLKRAIAQHLLLRTSREFDRLETCEAFLFDVVQRRKRPRQDTAA